MAGTRSAAGPAARSPIPSGPEPPRTVPSPRPSGNPQSAPGRGCGSRPLWAARAGEPAVREQRGHLAQGAPPLRASRRKERSLPGKQCFSGRIPLPWPHLPAEAPRPTLIPPAPLLSARPGAGWAAPFSGYRGRSRPLVVLGLGEWRGAEGARTTAQGRGGGGGAGTRREGGGASGARVRRNSSFSSSFSSSSCPVPAGAGRHEHVFRIQGEERERAGGLPQGTARPVRERDPPRPGLLLLLFPPAPLPACSSPRPLRPLLSRPPGARDRGYPVPPLPKALLALHPGPVSLSVLTAAPQNRGLSWVGRSHRDHRVQSLSLRGAVPESHRE